MCPLQHIILHPSLVSISNNMSIWLLHSVVSESLCIYSCLYCLQTMLKTDTIKITLNEVKLCFKCYYYRVRVMMFNTTFNNITAISWRSVLLVEETGVTRKNYWPAASHWQTWSHNVVSSTPRQELDSKLTTLVVIGTDCTGSCMVTTVRVLLTII